MIFFCHCELSVAIATVADSTGKENHPAFVQHRIKGVAQLPNNAIAARSFYHRGTERKREAAVIGSSCYKLSK